MSPHHPVRSVLDWFYQTHNIALTKSLAELIVSVSAEGIVTSRGQDLSAVLASEPTLQADFRHGEEMIEADEALIDPPSEDKAERKVNGKLILAEEIQEGNVGWKSIAFFLKALGGNHIVLFFTLWFGGSLSVFAMDSFSLWFLGRWSTQYERFPIDEIPIAW